MLVPPHKKGFLPPRETRSGNNEREVERLRKNKALTHTQAHTQRATIPAEHVQYNTTPTLSLSSHIIPHQASTL